MNKADIRIVFMGTPEFAVASLKALLDNSFNVICVVTSPDKPAGRGLKIQESAVKKFAKIKNLNILQPVKLSDPAFINELKNFNADLFIIVAFRMLPEAVWKMPRLGTFNLHASILPQYRGAAPINHAIINNETITGVTTFFINHEIDSGSLLFTKKTEIHPDETAGELHNKLMTIGSELVCYTTEAIISGNFKAIDQQNLNINLSHIKQAPKIFKLQCKINWNKNIDEIYNLIRGLSPYPTAYTEIVSPSSTTYSIKIYKAAKNLNYNICKPGTIITDGKTFLSIAGIDGLLNIEEIQISGKSRMRISEFLRGFTINNEWKAISI